MTTYYVGTPSSGNGDGSEGNPFSTIQAAIDQASGGDFVNVAAGTYPENVVVDKSLTIVGEEGVVIEGTFSDAPNNKPDGVSLFDWIKTQAAYDGSSGAGITIAADDVTIRDIAIREFLTVSRWRAMTAWSWTASTSATR